VSILSRRVEPEEVAAPGGQVDVQSRISHFISVTLISLARTLIEQAPGFFSYVIPEYLNVPLSRAVAKINYDEITIGLVNPTPSKEVDDRLEDPRDWPPRGAS